MKTGFSYLMVFILIFITACAGNEKKSEKDSQPEASVEPGQPKGEQPAQNTMRTDSRPGYDNKFDRGQKKRESIVDKYDNFGNLVERTENDYDKQGNIRFKNRYTYRYDERQRRVEQWFYQNTPDDRPVFSNVNHMKYDEKDQKTENIFIGYDAAGNETNWAKNVYKYNNEGRVTEDVTYNKEGFPLFKVNYNFEKGLLVSENFVYYDGKGNITEKKTLKYDEYGTVIQTLDK